MSKNQATISLDGNSLKFDQLSNIANGAKVEISDSAVHAVAESRAFIEQIIKGSDPVYGVNTGFGFFANKKIDAKDLRDLQVNLLRSHAGGYGKPLSNQEVRLALVLRLNVLLKGFTGVSLELCRAILDLIKADIIPVVPEYGSVGASGDLIPLAHLVLPLIGEGQVSYQNKIMPAKQALDLAGLKPINLAEKEGLSLINGTQIMLAVGGLALTKAEHLTKLADLVAALSYEALGARTSPIDPLIHQARGQHGQIKSAQRISQNLQGSYIFSEKTANKRIQDPYSIRCCPQVHGACFDTLEHVKNIIGCELNAATDNPLVFAKEGKILSGGNFHGEPLAQAFDIAAIGVSELANISERRLELLMNPNYSNLPAFLAADQGLNSGYMVLQYLSASLVNENKILSHPASTDSIPGNVGIEDFVSMGMTSARKFKKIVENIYVSLAAESLAAAQAIDMQSLSSKLGQSTKLLYQTLRQKVPTLKQDRVVSDDVAEAVECLRGYLV